MFEFKLGAIAFLMIPILGVLYYFRYKDRIKLWQIFQTKKNWESDIRLSDSGQYFWKKFFIIAALFFLIIGLMKPQFGERYETVKREGRQLFFIIDTSLSMLAEDGAKTRLDLAKYHIQQLLPKLNADFFSIIPYANTAYTYLPLTSDVSGANLFLEDMSVGMIGSGGSNIMNAMTVVKDTIKANRISEAITIIIFSDGEFTPRIESAQIKQLFNTIKVNALIIGLGSSQGEPIPQRDEQNKLIQYKKDESGKIVLSKRLDSQLEVLAKSLNGTVINGDVSPLVSEKIYRHLSKLETKELEQKQLITKIDRYHWFLMIALILLAFDYLLPRAQLKFTKSILLLCFLLNGTMPAFANHPGVDAYNNQDFQKAETEFDKALQKNPESGKIIYNLGNTYFKLNEHEKSIKAYEEAINRLPVEKQQNAFYNLGTTYLKKNDFEKALNAYKEVLKRDPSHLKTKQNIEFALRQKKQSQENKNNENENSDQDQSNETSGSESNSNNEQQSPPDAKENDDNENSAMNQDKEESTLSEQQIQFLVDSAEKEAREKRKVSQQKLFKEASW